MQFLDTSNMTLKDWDDVKHLASALSLDWHVALCKYMYENPGKIKVLGELKNNELCVDEITDEGVKEYRGAEAWKKMMDDVIKNKKDKLDT